MKFASIMVFTVLASLAAAAEPVGNLADELTDFGVPPRDTLQDNLAADTPLAIPGGTVKTTSDVNDALGSPTLLIDVWATGPHLGLPGALALPGAGIGGSFQDAMQNRLGDALALATAHDFSRAMIFYCTGARCWEAYNAALRAIHLGYKNVGWYRGGLASWHAASYRLAMVGQRNR